jgi:hypothetical protein
MVGPGLAQVFSHIPIDLKEEMVLISEQNREWPQAEIVRVALIKFIPELKKELASAKGTFHSTVRQGGIRRPRPNKVSLQRKDASIQVVTRLMDVMEHFTERLEQLEARNRTVSVDQSHL